MLRVGRMLRVLRRLRQLRHVDVILRSLRVPRVDVAAGDSSRLLFGEYICTGLLLVRRYVWMYARVHVWMMYDV